MGQVRGCGHSSEWLGCFINERRREYLSGVQCYGCDRWDVGLAEGDGSAAVDWRQESAETAIVRAYLVVSVPIRRSGSEYESGKCLPRAFKLRPGDLFSRARAAEPVTRVRSKNLEMEVMGEYILSCKLFSRSIPGAELSSRRGHFNGTIVRQANTKAPGS